MNTAQTVDNLLAQWKEQGLSKVEMTWKLAEACLGWSYVFGAVGELCTPSVRRKYYNNYETRNPGEAEQIKKNCQVLSNKSAYCDGCRFYPNGSTRCYDCRGFTRWCLGKMGITLQGAGATSQWNTESNWIEKGEIKDLPDGVLACFFNQNQSDHKTMEHTGFVLSGQIIHCSGTVKHEKVYKRITHYAIPKGLDELMPTDKPTLRIGSTGVYVVECQNDLIQLGYDLAPYGADGKYGKLTAKRITEFQSASGLVADGVCGKKTWAALDEAVKPTPAPTKLYTVHIPHQNEDQCEKLKVLYPDSWKTEE